MAGKNKSWYQSVAKWIGKTKNWYQVVARCIGKSKGVRSYKHLIQEQICMQIIF